MLEVMEQIDTGKSCKILVFSAKYWFCLDKTSILQIAINSFLFMLEIPAPTSVCQFRVVFVKEHFLFSENYFV